MSETISDIIREMRDEVRTSRENNPDPRTRIFLSTSNMAIEDFADRIEAAARPRRELLCRLRDDNIELKIENSKLRALVDELADALEKIDDICDGDMCKYFEDTKHCSQCKYLNSCETGVAHCALKIHESAIAKAKEVK